MIEPLALLENKRKSYWRRKMDRDSAAENAVL